MICPRCGNNCVERIALNDGCVESCEQCDYSRCDGVSAQTFVLCGVCRCYLRARDGAATRDYALVCGVCARALRDAEKLLRSV